MIPPHTSGYVTRYLMSGKHAEQLAQIGIVENVIVTAKILETGEEIDPSDIGREDFEKAIEYLQHYGH